MNPEYPSSASPTPSADQMHNPIASMQPGERNICEVTRHPIGMLGTYLMSGFVLIALAVVAFIVAPKVFSSESRTTITEIGALAFIILAVIVTAFVFVANKVYWGNRWILTTDSLTQITQTSLFSKQSSQLSLGNLEDVTAEQNGILTHMFKYGVLRVETAGERSKFVFLFCPNPDYYAQQILGAREAFEQDIHQVGGVNQGAYPAAAPQQPVPTPADIPPAASYTYSQPVQQTPTPPSPVPQEYTNADPNDGVNIGTEQ
jgi:hypothetical protein